MFKTKNFDTSLNIDQMMIEEDEMIIQENGTCLLNMQELNGGGGGSDSLPNQTNNVKRIDFVLVYRIRTYDPEPLQQQHDEIRERFEENLFNEGLILKHVASTVANEVVFVHIYAPWDVLARYAEIMSLRMPMKTIQSNLKLLFDEECNESPSRAFTTPFSRDRDYLFDIPEKDREDFFSPSQRTEIVDYILRRTRFKDKNDVFSIGINKLLTDYVYEAAYPLHDVGNECKHNNCKTNRCQLQLKWASLSCIFKYQPLEQIVQYFGIKISMYYAWVGFYTLMLIPASVMGIISIIYGVSSMQTDTPTNDLCNYREKVLMCPACAINCNYTRVSDGCMQAQASHVFGNITTIVFAIFISLWATIYLEMWKRYSAEITHKWDLTDFSTVDEYPRPEFLANLSKSKIKTRINPINRIEEPYISFIRGRLPYFIISSSFVILCIVVTLLIMISIIVYRVSFQIAILAQNDPEASNFIRTYGEVLITATAAFINLFLIILLSLVYKRLAYFLTEMEMPRTQMEFDNSLTLKMYVFEFVNYYSSFFYIAFFKGRFASMPPDGSLQKDKQNYFVESCPIGGCYFDLTIQMAIIFLGKAIISSLFEYLYPYFIKIYNRSRYLAPKNNSGKSNGNGVTPNGNVKLPQWEEDFVLESWDHMSLFYEYLELIIQFGFVTIFVSAFPLAPLLALLNNIFEIRFDARKMLTNFKRPVAQRVKDIGIWYSIMDAIGKLSVFTNSMIIAFTTDIIPRIMYYVENNHSLNKYFQSTLSFYTITDKDPELDANYCVYNGYREPPWENTGRAYNYTTKHWHVLVAKIVFVIAFQNIVAALNSLLKALIPDEPRKLRLQKRQHLYLTNELIIRQELKSRKSFHQSQSPPPPPPPRQHSHKQKPQFL